MLQQPYLKYRAVAPVGLRDRTWPDQVITQPPRWLSTHPDPASRLRELDTRAASLEPVMEQARRAGRMPRCR